MRGCSDKPIIQYVRAYVGGVCVCVCVCVCVAHALLVQLVARAILTLNSSKSSPADHTQFNALQRHTPFTIYIFV